MTIADAARALGGRLVTGAAGAARTVEGGYVSDLLSDVMAHAAEGDVWITLQRHPNIVAIAHLKALAGIVLVVAGCFLIPFGSLKDFAREVRSGSFLSPAMGFALLTALATSGYSLFDKYGSLPPYRAAGTLGSLGYMALEWLLTGVMLYGIARFGLRQRETLRPLVTHAKKVWIAAFLMTFSYGFVMVAYQFANVSYVVGFRQLSVVLGVVLGALVLKERVTQGRAVGTAIIAIGLILIALA